MPATSKHRAQARAFVDPELFRAFDEAVVAKALARQHIIAARRALKQAEALLRACTRRWRASGRAIDHAALLARAARERAKAQRPDMRGRTRTRPSTPAAPRKGNRR